MKVPYQKITQSNSKSKEASSSQDYHASHDYRLVVEVFYN